VCSDYRLKSLLRSAATRVWHSGDANVAARNGPLPSPHLLLESYVGLQWQGKSVSTSPSPRLRFALWAICSSKLRNRSGPQGPRSDDRRSRLPGRSRNGEAIEALTSIGTEMGAWPADLFKPSCSSGKAGLLARVCGNTATTRPSKEAIGPLIKSRWAQVLRWVEAAGVEASSR